MTMTADYEKILARKVECEADGLYFARFFFKQRFGAKMNIGPHHRLIQKALDRTMLPTQHPDFISRLIINIPPGYSKTEIAVYSYIARGLGLNPRSRYLHLSASQPLALYNSSVTRSIIQSPDYQAMWNVQTREDRKNKELWHTTKEGGLTASAAGGALVTGFRAGHMDPDHFTGAIVIDDPIKMEDIRHPKKVEAVNDRYMQNAASRVTLETNPIIVIGQRGDRNDLSGFLLRGGSGEKWHHLNLPVFIETQRPYPEAYTHGIAMPYSLKPGWLWPFKHNEAHEVALKANRRRWRAQYLQDPLGREDELHLWDENMLKLARSIVFGQATRTVVAIDPATKDASHTDEHGIGVASFCGDNQYRIEADYTLSRGTPVQWAQRAMAAYKEHAASAIVIEVNQGGDMCRDTLRNAGFQGRIIAVHASKNKTARAEPISALYELGFVQHRSGLGRLEDEMLDFDPLTGKSKGKSPNRVDWMVWALTELSGGTTMEELLQMALRGNAR